MVYARALRALECITHAGPSPALGTIRDFDKSVIPFSLMFGIFLGSSHGFLNYMASKN
jgi:hypothetical protein